MKSTLLTNVKCTIQYVDYWHHVEKQISTVYSSCLTETLCQLISNSPFPSPQPLATTFHSILWIWLFWIPHINGIMQYLSFCDWLISVRIMSSRLIYVVPYCRISFFLRLSIFYSLFSVYVTFSLSIHLLQTFVSTFWLLGIMLQWNRSANISSRSWFQFFLTNTQKWDC